MSAQVTGDDGQPSPQVRDRRIDELRRSFDGLVATADGERLSLVELLIDRFESAPADGGGRADDLLDAAYQCEWSIGVSEPHAAAWVYAHYLLANVHDFLWFLHQEPRHLDRAIGALEAVVWWHADPEVLIHLAELRLRRYYVMFPDAGTAELDRSADGLEHALALDPSPEERRQAEAILGLVLAELVVIDLAVVAGEYQVERTTRAIKLLTENLGTIRLDSPLRGPAVAALARLHSFRYTTPELCPAGTTPDAELDTSIEYLRELVAADWDADTAFDLAHSLVMRTYDRPDRGDYAEAVRMLEKIADETGRPEPDPAHLELLGELYLAQAKDRGDQERVDRTVAFLEGAVETAAGTVNPALCTLLLEAYSLSDRTTAAQLDRAESLIGAMLAGDENDRDPKEELLGILALTVAERAVRERRPAQLARARVLLGERARFAREFDWSHLAHLAVLGMLVVVEHDADQSVTPWSPLRMAAWFPPEQRAEVVEWLADRLDHLPSSVPVRPEYLAAIGLLRADVAPPFGIPNEIREEPLRLAVTTLDVARAALSPGDPLGLVVLRQLGSNLAELGLLTEDLVLIRRSAGLLDEALGAMPPGHPLRGGTLALFGTTIMSARLLGPIGAGFTHARQALVEASDDPGFTAENRAMCCMLLGVLELAEQMKLPGRQNFTAGLAHVKRAVDLLPDGHPERLGHRQALAEMLMDRFRIAGDIRDLETARAHLAAILTELHRPGVRSNVDEASVAENLSQAELQLAVATGGSAAGQFDAVIELLRARVATMEADEERNVHRDQTALVVVKVHLATVLVQRAIRTADVRDMPEVAEQLTGATARVGPGSVLYTSTHMVSATLLVGIACLAKDRTRFDAALDRVDALLADPEITDEMRMVGTGFLGSARLMWFEATGERSDRDAGIEFFERSAEIIPAGLRFSWPPPVLDKLSDAYWHRGRPADVRRAVDIGLDALREQTREVVLQTGGDRALAPTAAAAHRAAGLAARCLAVGLRADAVRAIEAGRGLVLHAASATSDITTILRDSGHGDLASEWMAQADRADDPQDRFGLSAVLPGGLDMLPSVVPSDLRHRVLSTLAVGDSERVLAALPTMPQIAAALTVLNMDALVYLVPAQDGSQGRALLVSAAGETSECVLPLLNDDDPGPVGAYLAARRAAEAPGLSQERRATLKSLWSAELDHLCGWAWRTVIGPLHPHLDVIGQDGRTPRIVLVPLGSLSVVPWHAARHDPPAGPHHAVRDFVFTYASSARQLCALADRPRRPPEQAPAVVVDPSMDLVAATYEARYLHQRYPNARFLGALPDGPPIEGNGNPDDLVDLLPSAARAGATMVHFGCHAESGPTPSTSFLRLAGGARLSVSRILDRARDLAPGQAGGLIVLAACQSSLTEAAHDEGLTLASAFVAAGATGVTGALWAIPDLPAGVLMCLYHREITESGSRPADALRAVQLWALDERRIVPADLPDELVSGVDEGLRAPEVWAGFTHCGW